MKNILIIGSGMDVLDKKRGEQINQLFDNIMIIKYQLYFLDEFKEYIGNPNMLVAPGLEFKKYSYRECLNSEEEKLAWDKWYDETELKNKRQRIYDCIKHSSIREIWRNANDYERSMFYDFKQVRNLHHKVVKVKPIKYAKSSTVGMTAIYQALEHNYKVYYMGFDSGYKGTHYYHNLEDTFVPYKKPVIQEPDQYFELGLLRKKKLVTHVDKLINKIAK